MSEKIVKSPWLPWLFCSLLLPLQAEATGDSLNYLTLRDTIYLRVGNFGEKIFEHRMERKQTLYSLARFYGMSLADLYLYNPGLREHGVSVGQNVRIPIPNRAIIRYPTPGFTFQDFVPVVYVVQPGDNLYRICKHYFRMPIEVVQMRNGLSDQSVRVGQHLHIGWMSLYGVPEMLRQTQGGPLWNRSNQLEQQFVQESYSHNERFQQGIAHWPKDSRMSSSDLYALHREAPVNSIISVTNPMTSRTAYVKVLGKIPDFYEENVVIVLSPAVANMLGALDPNFFVQVQYFK